MAAPPAAAQDVFSLPPGTATPTARAPGPVDSDSPQVRTRPAPTATAPRETTAARPSPAAPATRTAPRPAPQARATVRPAVVGTANPAATATPLATTAAPGTSDAAPITGGNSAGLAATPDGKLIGFRSNRVIEINPYTGVTANVGNVMAGFSTTSLDATRDGAIYATPVSGDRRLHRAQAVQRAVVEVASIDEWTQ